MELHDALATRRTVQRYTGEPVPDDALATAFAAAQWAPCHKLTWPWRFTVVGAEAREQLVQVAIRLKAAKKGCPPEQMEGRVRSTLGSAGTLILVGQVLAEDAHRREEDYAATACAVQNLMLSLHAQGYGSKWSTGGFSTAPETYALAGIDAAAECIVGCVLAGPAAVEPKAPPRPEVTDHVRRIP